MKIQSTLIHLAALAAASAVSVTAQASLTVYTDEASFLQAVAGSITGTDSFDDFQTAAGPVLRSAGGIDYQAASPPGGHLARSGPPADGWLAAGTPYSGLLFSDFAPGVFAAGGTFFGSNTRGTQADRGVIVVKAGDADGSLMREVTWSATSHDFFVGFVSDSALNFVSARYVGGDRAVATVNDLTLAQAVPEPGNAALMLAGLGAVGFSARRLRQR